MSEDKVIEAMILVKGLTAPRVCPDDIDANIIHTEVVKHVTHSGQVLRWAVLTARNGFAVTGRPSASVSAENDNAEVGERVAIQNAKAEMWPLMGYELRSKLFEQAKANQATWADVATHTISEDAISQSVSYKVTLKDGKGTWRGTLPIQLDWDSLSYIQAAVIEDINRQLAAQVR